MYFPANTARKLAVDAGPFSRENSRIVALSYHSLRALFLAITDDSLSVWKLRPSVVLAHLKRSPLSIQEHGQNKMVHWSPDGETVVLETSNSHLVFINVNYSWNPTPLQLSFLTSAVRRQFTPGSGEAIPLQRIQLSLSGVIRVVGTLLWISARRSYILYSTRHPTSVQRIAWPEAHRPGEDSENVIDHSFVGYESWEIGNDVFPWLLDQVPIISSSYSELDSTEVWITSDGAAYFVYLDESGLEKQSTQLRLDKAASSFWRGVCINTPLPVADDFTTKQNRALLSAINPTFSLVALAMSDGQVLVVGYPQPEKAPSKSQVLKPQDTSLAVTTGTPNKIQWSSDGCALAVGWERGWALWSVGGRCLVWGFNSRQDVDRSSFTDFYMLGVADLFWGPENVELVLLSSLSERSGDREQLFVLPLSKSAVASQQTPDNTRYAVMHSDDRVMIYRGADQPDMSIINPESDVWQYIKVPLSYMASNWPIRYTAISSDGRLLAVAGRRGFAHYSSTSGRWKLFSDPNQEQAFVVVGGMIWFHHVLIVAMEIAKSHQLRLYSRDLELSSHNIVFKETVAAPVVLLSLVDNSLLVYTSDNILLHYLVIPTAKSIKLHFCGSISFDDVIAFPWTIRCLSWMIPGPQKQFGDPSEDLAVATVLLLVGGRLVLLRPRKSDNQEVKYDMQIMADQIEFCWIHLRGIGSLENSLWGYDGGSVRVWLDALALDVAMLDRSPEDFESVHETLSFSLDFYPLSVLMDKGIILGTESELVTRPSISFTQFRIVTSTHLFLQHMLRAHLENSRVEEAVQFALNYQSLVYFSHALEVLLHSVLEEDPIEESKLDHSKIVLRSTVDFLDHFNHALDIVVACARKTEMARWERLFDVVGNPKALFETCLTSGQLKTAASYLIILHNMEQLKDDHADTVRLLRAAHSSKDWTLCRELIRFVHSVDASGESLNQVLSDTGIIEKENDEQVPLSPRPIYTSNGIQRSFSLGNV